MSKTKIYNSKKVTLTPEEKAEYERKVQKQIEKYQRDIKCGGVDGYSYVRLHDRHNK